jgi:phosphatidylcholine synthase
VVLAFASLRAAFAGDFRAAFAWLLVSTVIDATDGWLARRARVHEATPEFDGGTLDAIVDYLTFVFVPAAIVVEAGLLPEPWAMAVACAMLLASAYGFSQRDAKTSDHFFKGFPSYWNVVAFYLYAAHMDPRINAAWVVGLSAFVFVPLKYVYPSRTPVLLRTTNVLCTAWAALLGWLIWRLPEVSAPALFGSLLFPVYYGALSLLLEARRRGRITLR